MTESEGSKSAHMSPLPEFMGIYGNPKENLHSKPLPPTRKSEKKPTIQRGLLLVVVVGWLSTTHAEAPCGGNNQNMFTSGCLAFHGISSNLDQSGLKYK